MKSKINDEFRKEFYKYNKIKLNNRRETGYIKYMTDKEFKQIKRYIEKKQSPSLKMCLMIMMYLGLRVGEVVRLKRDNFNNDFSSLIFELEKSHKLHERHIPKFLKIALNKYYKKYEEKMIDGYLFFANQSKNPHLQRSTINFLFTKMRRELGLTHIYYTRKDGNNLFRISPHTLRHYALWKYYKASGNDIIAAQQMIGHVNIKTTAKYINALKSGLGEISIIKKSFNI